MQLKQKLSLLLRVSSSQFIARRYFVVNGFDGALAILGIIMGFYVSGNHDTQVVINACIGAAIALGVSGFSSAYVSESAERIRELQSLEDAMQSDLSESAHARAAQTVPYLIGFVNGAAPLFFALLIMSPLWLSSLAENIPISPLESSIVIAFMIIFFLGIFLGKISGTFWLWSGIRTLLIGLITCVLIILLAPN
jgi:predicted membrane protein (TIGR00267 family)